MERISESWLKLEPLKTPNGYKEDFEEYYQRIQQNDKLKHIPNEVLKNWIYDQHDFRVTLKNYAWLNFYEMKFEKVEWPTENFTEIETVEFYLDYVRKKSELKSIEDFCFYEYWNQNGTWIVPPIILDVGSLKYKIPRLNRLTGSYLFIDGHTRLGYLRALVKISKMEKTNLAKNHWIYLMQQI